MISYLEGKIISISDDRITLLVNGIGYEILIPAYAIAEIRHKGESEDVTAFYISYNQTERQPKPILVGFKNVLDREFFELFITVEDIGPAAAIRALNKSVKEIARSIEEKDIKALKQLKGIGERKAEKIVASLKGKVAKYALMQVETVPYEKSEDFKKEVEYVLVKQLGYKSNEAKKMIADAMERSPRMATSEELFDEVYRGQKT